jgi:hypothetical protein
MTGQALTEPFHESGQLATSVDAPMLKGGIIGAGQAAGELSI